MFNPLSPRHVGVISGATAHNITARIAILQWIFRVVPAKTKPPGAPTYLCKKKNARSRTADARVVPAKPYIEIRPFDVASLNRETAGRTLCARSPATNASQKSVGTSRQFQKQATARWSAGPDDIAQGGTSPTNTASTQFEAGHQFMRVLLNWLK